MYNCLQIEYNVLYKRREDCFVWMYLATYEVIAVVYLLFTRISKHLRTLIVIVRNIFCRFIRGLLQLMHIKCDVTWRYRSILFVIWLTLICR